MKKIIFLLLFSTGLFAQNIPTRWDELTASDWPKALEKSNRTIILPIGILEKHGPHAPIGSDLIRARQWAKRAAEIEYAVIFPDYFYGQVNEAKHIQGTFSLPSDLTMELLEATCKEIARNGFNKILIVNTHGGNPSMLRYFVQNQMESQRDYAVYFFDPGADPEYEKKLAELRKSDASQDMHAGERETSELLYLRPELVQLDRATSESGADQKRLKEIPDVYRGIWWYASFPNHYAGRGETGTKELGKLVTDHAVNSIATALKAIKEDTTTLELQKKYFEDVKKAADK
ncbi:creatininase [Christiangramia fulva]|uniref:Creatininase n=1 Tax=Christiangramia fulva TaxID=2126553 RepID=A0A2R3Z1V6_9FLAO|nr:creatininase family protein [Christiangramia fulva]AVR44271.1 creatininase [Christiangramia fulva]